MRLVALSTSTRSFCSEGRYRALMVTAPYFSELVSSWAVGYRDKDAVLHPHHEGDAQGVAEAQQEFWGTRVCWNPLGCIEPLLLNAVGKPAPTAPGLGGWWGNSTFPQAGPVSKGGMWKGAGSTIVTPTCCWILLLKYFWMSLRLLAEPRAR